MTDKTDAYSVLGVDRRCEKEVIAAAYKAKMKMNHPDLAVDDADRARREVVCKNLGAALGVLENDRSRGILDARLANEESSRFASSGSSSAESKTVGPGRANQGGGVRGARSSADDDVDWDNLTFASKNRVRAAARRSDIIRGQKRRMTARRVRVARMPATWFRLRSAIRVPSRNISSNEVIFGSISGAVYGAASYLIRVYSPIAKWFSSWKLNFLKVDIQRPAFSLLGLGICILIGVVVSVGLYSILVRSFSGFTGGGRRLALVMVGIGVVSLFTEYLVAGVLYVLLGVIVVKVGSKLLRRYT